MKDFFTIQNIINLVTPYIMPIIGFFIAKAVNKANDIASKKLGQEKYAKAYAHAQDVIKGVYYVVAKTSQKTDNKFDDKIAEVIKLAKEKFEQQTYVGAWDELKGDAIAKDMAGALHADPSKPDL